MHSLLRFLLLTLALLSWPVNANLEYDVQLQPEVSEVVQNLAKRIDALPDPLFMDESDKRKVSILLADVIRIQNQLIETFERQLKTYRDKADSDQWFFVESSYLTLKSLNVSKQDLLEQTTNANRDRLTGFGPYGVTQFKQEWQLTQLNVEYLVYLQTRSFNALITEIFISPVPVIWASLKVLFIYFCLAWWLS